MATDFDKISKWYDIFFNQIYFRILYGKIITFIHEYLKPDYKFLDIACGTGNWLLRLKANYSLNLYGVDESRGMIDVAIKKDREINFSIGLAENLLFSSYKFDLVSIVESFHHFKDQRKALSEARRVLKNQGYLILIDPALDGLAKIIWQATKLFSFEKESKYYYSKDLIALIEESGFTIVKSRNRFANAWILAKKI